MTPPKYEKIGNSSTRTEIIKVENNDINRINRIEFTQLSSAHSDTQNRDMEVRPFAPNKVNHDVKNESPIYTKLFGKDRKQEKSNHRNNQENESQSNDNNVDEKESEIDDKVKEIIQAAEKEAAKIEEEARALKEQAREKGYEDGYRQGIEAGKKEALEEMQKETNKLVEMLANILNDFNAINDAVFDDIEQVTLKLSLIIAKKLACRELSMNPEAVVDVVKTALTLVEDGKQIIVKVNPLDFGLVKKYRPDILELINGYSGNNGDMNNQNGSENNGIDIVIERDDTVSRAGCVIETKTQALDATFETRFDEIVDAILS